MGNLLSPYVNVPDEDHIVSAIAPADGLITDIRGAFLSSYNRHRISIDVVIPNLEEAMVAWINRQENRRFLDELKVMEEYDWTRMLDFLNTKFIAAHQTLEQDAAVPDMAYVSELNEATDIHELRPIGGLMTEDFCRLDVWRPTTVYLAPAYNIVKPRLNIDALTGWNRQHDRSNEGFKYGHGHSELASQIRGYDMSAIHAAIDVSLMPKTHF